ncbi:20257_t:CDS:2 [Racocetra persica]|uniref:20257_t:CDS:1 n=1 Tax=Racocetra persica TaxID=160502 RepID=A0ACA9R073_9GLOM|nr:20257_t:CDS:2 [Racocetra persica]
MNDNNVKDELSMTNELPETDMSNSGAQEMAEFAEKARVAIEKVEKERNEYRRLFAQANGEVLKKNEEIRYLKDRVANKEAESLRQTTMAREKMNVQLQKDANMRELGQNMRRLNINGTLARGYEEEAGGENCFNCNQTIEGSCYIAFDGPGNKLGFVCQQCTQSLESELTEEE